MPLLLQVAPLCAVTAYLLQCRVYMHRRNFQSWESLIGQMGAGSGDLSEPFLSQEDFDALKARLREDPKEWRNLWSLFRSARLALEMADFAERNTGSGPTEIEPLLLETVREDAMQVRVSALFAFAGVSPPK